LAIAAGILLLFNFFSIKELKYFFNKEGKYKVIKVLDGDTFVIPPDQIIRLASIDAPGIEFCLGKEAKERLEKLILNKYVKIVSGGRDNFYRSLALVYVDGKLVNEIMVVEGLARYSRGGVFPETKEAKERIKALAKKAEEQKIGLWSSKCHQKTNLEKPECQIKGNVNKARQTRIYHFPGCTEYEHTVVELDLGEQWFCSEKEAQEAGYKKSEHCYGKKYKRNLEI